MSKYRAGDVLDFGGEWLIVLENSSYPNVTISGESAFIGGYDPEESPTTYTVLFNILDVKRKVEENET